MTLKTLVTGVAAAAMVGAAAAGVTSIASSTVSASPAVQPVVWDIPMPQQPAPGVPATENDLRATLEGLANSSGSFSGAKAYLVEGRVGRIEGLTADRAYKNAVADGYFPLGFSFGPINSDGTTATTTVTATPQVG